MPTPTCVNLRECYGARYRVAYEASYHADHGPGARAPDPWLMIVPCRFGHLFPHGGSTLAASVDGFPKIAGRRARAYGDHLGLETGSAG